MTKSQAVFTVLALLGGVFRWLTLFSLLPSRIADSGYEIFARNRHDRAVSSFTVS
jgi:predicted DCC family thiol-disulfide oxidoreductase YuxK